MTNTTSGQAYLDAAAAIDNPLSLDEIKAKILAGGHDAQELLQHAIRSLEEQTRPRLVVSQDAVYAACEEYDGWHPENRGTAECISAVLRVGIRKMQEGAQGEGEAPDAPRQR